VSLTFASKLQSLSPTSNTCYSRNPSNYTFGNIINPTTDCAWISFNQAYDYVLQGLNDYSSFLTNIQFKGTDINGTRNNGWNLTNSSDSAAITNRAIGNVELGLSISQNTQSSHLDNATPLNDTSVYLLGLQTTNTKTNYDMNSNRPQLNTSYRRSGDYFGWSAIPLTGHTGAIARTGQSPLAIARVICP
jgi:hypothetical protein